MMNFGRKFGEFFRPRFDRDAETLAWRSGLVVVVGEVVYSRAKARQG